MPARGHEGNHIMAEPSRYIGILILMLCLASPSPAGASEWWRPTGRISWDWQLSEPFDLDRRLGMIDLDLFDTEAAAVALLKAHGVRTVCYINAGAWEDWRDDAGAFSKKVLGKDYEGWDGERWFDIRRIDLLAGPLGKRLDLCKSKGFDGVEPDNIDGYTNDTGFPLNEKDQLRFNRWFAAQAHRRGLSVGLKNDPDQASDLVAEFDWVLTEDCFAEGWCAQMLPFIDSGKAVFAAEYTDTGMTIERLCDAARNLGFNAIIKDRDLDSRLQSCD